MLAAERDTAASCTRIWERRATDTISVSRILAAGHWIVAVADQSAEVSRRNSFQRCHSHVAAQIIRRPRERSCLSQWI
jgi:hypothetical protein